MDGYWCLAVDKSSRGYFIVQNDISATTRNTMDENYWMKEESPENNSRYSNDWWGLVWRRDKNRMLLANASNSGSSPWWSRARNIHYSWKIGVILSDIEVGIERSWSVRPRIIVLFLNQREINLLSVKSGWLKLCRCSVDLKKLWLSWE